MRNLYSCESTCECMCFPEICIHIPCVYVDMQLFSDDILAEDMYCISILHCSWCKCNLSTLGDEDAAIDDMQTQRGYMRDVLQLNEIPDIDDEGSAELDHMRMENMVPRLHYINTAVQELLACCHSSSMRFVQGQVFCDRYACLDICKHVFMCRIILYIYIYRFL